MKQPYRKLPKNDLSERQHQRAGEIAVSLMSKPVQRQKQPAPEFQKKYA